MQGHEERCTAEGIKQNKSRNTHLVCARSALDLRAHRAAAREGLRVLSAGNRRIDSR